MMRIMNCIQMIPGSINSNNRLALSLSSRTIWKAVLLFAAAILLLSNEAVVSECPNACSGHGICGAYDSCLCRRNWMAADCSQRICQFGRAHVDTPLGDIDTSGGMLSGASTNEIVAVHDMIYPKGANEQYPNMVDSDDNILRNTAHDYRECSNKGICDRILGQCVCLEGYEGSACQRASCPIVDGLVCNGHGTCETIRDISASDNGNIYRLWDEDISMGCNCDPGYYDPVCTSRKCEFGYDPLYAEAEANVRYSNWTIQIYTADKTPPKLYRDQVVLGNYSIIFYDINGEDWETGPIDINARCNDITNALEALPNNVIKKNSVLCFNWASAQDPPVSATQPSAVRDVYSGKLYPWGKINYTDTEWLLDPDVIIHTRYTLAFPENPGRLQEIRINKYLDGKRPTLFSLEDGSEEFSTLGWHIYVNGFTGEFIDHVNDLCAGVYIKLDGRDPVTGYHKLLPIDATGLDLVNNFKSCLGDSDLDSSNNADKLLYDWDAGTTANPHLIKLIDASYKLYNDALDAMFFGNPGTHTDGVTKWRRAGMLTDFRAGKNQLEVEYDYPVSRLCANEINPDPRNDIPEDTPISYCRRENPPGFFVVMYSRDDIFYSFNNFQDDHGPYRVNARTMFYVFTTKGTLQEVNPWLSVYNIDEEWSPAQKIKRSHTNVLHTVVTRQVRTNPMPHFDPIADMSCEFDSYVRSKYFNQPNLGNRACLNKGDLVMVFNKHDVIKSQDTNPLYLNMYKVNKIFEADMNKMTDVGKLTSDALIKAPNTVHQIVLDYGTNARYVYDKTKVAAVDNPPNSSYTSTMTYNYKIRIQLSDPDDEKCRFEADDSSLLLPTLSPSPVPTEEPSAAPTLKPTAQPSFGPTVSPSRFPTQNPTAEPTPDPSLQPTLRPSAIPTLAPTFYTNLPLCRMNPSNGNIGCKFTLGEIEVFNSQSVVMTPTSYNENQRLSSLPLCFDGNEATICSVGNTCPNIIEIEMGDRQFSKISLKNVISILDGAEVTVLANDVAIFSTILRGQGAYFDVFPDNFPILKAHYHSRPERGGFLMSSLYKFIPPKFGYDYVQECSGRGKCDADTGICNCFAGFTGGDCSTQNAFAI